MSAPPQPEVRIFRVAVLPLYAAMVAIGLPPPLCLVILNEGWRQVDVGALLFGALTGALAGLLYAWLMALCFTLKLAPEGVSGHSCWGIRRFIRWQDIATVRPFRLLSLRYLRLHPQSGARPTWIALFQARNIEFKQELGRLAPPDSPVRNHLQ
jgi:hypothetical protein